MPPHPDLGEFGHPNDHEIVDGACLLTLSDKHGIIVLSDMSYVHGMVFKGMNGHCTACC